MAKFIYKYDEGQYHIYRNNGVLKDAYFFNLVDEKEHDSIKSPNSFYFSNAVYRILLLAVLFNYFVLYAILWIFRKLISDFINLFNMIVINLIKFRLRTDEE